MSPSELCAQRSPQVCQLLIHLSDFRDSGAQRPACFPYVIQSGLAARYLQESVRILHPLGRRVGIPRPIFVDFQLTIWAEPPAGPEQKTLPAVLWWNFSECFAKWRPT
jgi:hypothetical protein